MADTEDDRSKRILGYIGVFAAGALLAGIAQVIENRATLTAVETRQDTVYMRLDLTRAQLGDIRERLATLEAACQ